MQKSALQVLAVVLSVSASGLHAQQKPQLPGGYPNKPIRIIVGAAPGGGSDTLARLTSAKLSDRWGNPVLVENRASGVGGLVGMEFVSKAAPDGYTLMMAGSSSVMSSVFIIKTSFDVRKDFVPVAQLTALPWVLSSPASLPVNSVKELIAYARSRPGQLNYASPGTGSAAHMGMELFNYLAGTKITHIPYKGTGPAMVDMMAGRVQMLLGTPIAVMPQAKAGKVKALAVTTARRSRLMPDVPTLMESGLADFDVSGWLGILAPAGTAPAVVQALNREYVQILNLPDVQAALVADGSEPTPSSPEQFREAMMRELDRWDKVIKATNLKLDPE